jgi:hypothetical protein
MTSLNRTLRSIALASVAVPALMAMPAFAQDSAAAAAEEGDDAVLVVTARRREENLIDVPIAVSAFSGDALEARGAVDLTDIGNITPNTTLETSRGTNSTLSAFIRGIGQQDPVSGFEQGVGIYLDDVYLNRPQAARLNMLRACCPTNSRCACAGRSAPMIRPKVSSPRRPRSATCCVLALQLHACRVVALAITRPLASKTTTRTFGPPVAPLNLVDMASRYSFACRVITAATAAIRAVVIA